MVKLEPRNVYAFVFPTQFIKMVTPINTIRTLDKVIVPSPDSSNKFVSQHFIGYILYVYPNGQHFSIHKIEYIYGHIKEKETELGFYYKIGENDRSQPVYRKVEIPFSHIYIHRLNRLNDEPKEFKKLEHLGEINEIKGGAIEKIINLIKDDKTYFRLKFKFDDVGSQLVEMKVKIGKPLIARIPTEAYLEPHQMINNFFIINSHGMIEKLNTHNYKALITHLETGTMIARAESHMKSLTDQLKHILGELQKINVTTIHILDTALTKIETLMREQHAKLNPDQKQQIESKVVKMKELKALIQSIERKIHNAEIISKRIEQKEIEKLEGTLKLLEHQIPKHAQPISHDDIDKLIGEYSQIDQTL